MPGISAKNQAAFGEYLRKAQAGDPVYLWLHRLVLSAGYTPVAGQGRDSLVLVNAKVLAAGLGVTVRTFRSYMREGLPIYRESFGNRPALFDVFAVLLWREGREKEKLELAGGDPLMVGDSKDKWLSEYRKQKARQVKRENDFAEAELVNASDVGIQLGEIGRVFRAQAEAIERLHGREVGSSIRRMIDRAEEEWGKVFKKRKGKK